MSRAEGKGWTRRGAQISAIDMERNDRKSSALWKMMNRHCATATASLEYHTRTLYTWRRLATLDCIQNLWLGYE